MGIQIYIKVSAIKDLIDGDDIEKHKDCHCGNAVYGSATATKCKLCDTPISVYKQRYFKLTGLLKWFLVLDDVICHDANKWGSSREPILDWLDTHNISQNDYYFA